MPGLYPGHKLVSIRRHTGKRTPPRCPRIVLKKVVMRCFKISFVVEHTNTLTEVTGATKNRGTRLRNVEEAKSEARRPGSQRWGRERKKLLTMGG